MIDVSLPSSCPAAVALAPLRVRYAAAAPPALLAAPGTLAVLGFGAVAAESEDPRWLRLPLMPLDAATVAEVWQIDAAVEHGRAGAVRYAAGGGWLFGAIELDEAAHGGLERAAVAAYRALAAFSAARAECHVLRIWNYFGAINRGSGDAERYKRFCAGRALGMGTGQVFADGYPAATAIGVPGAPDRLQLYWLAATAAGTRVENPRQLSAWRYPRAYGPTPPSFARGMRLPGGAGLAISGTAAIVGHASQAAGDLDAQLAETFANLDALLTAAGVDGGLDARSPLKVYLRDPAQAGHVADFLAAHLSPAVPRLLLAGDVCRAELAVEIDGWRFPRAMDGVL